jgi:hypothetical protein
MCSWPCFMYATLFVLELLCSHDAFQSPSSTNSHPSIASLPLPPYIVTYTEVPHEAYPFISATYSAHIFVEAAGDESFSGLAKVLCTVVRKIGLPVQQLAYATSPVGGFATIHYGDALEDYYVAQDINSEQDKHFSSTAYGPLEGYPEYDLAIRRPFVVLRSLATSAALNNKRCPI